MVMICPLGNLYIYMVAFAAMHNPTSSDKELNCALTTHFEKCLLYL